MMSLTQINSSFTFKVHVEIVCVVIILRFFRNVIYCLVALQYEGILNFFFTFLN